MKEKKNNQVDFLYGAGTVILSLVLWFWMIPTQIKTRKAYFNDVAMIPRFAVIVMAIMGLLLMIISCKKVGSVKQLLDFSAFKANWKGMLKLVLFIAALVLYIKLIPIAGFVICTIPFSPTRKPSAVPRSRMNSATAACPASQRPRQPTTLYAAAHWFPY